MSFAIIKYSHTRSKRLKEWPDKDRSSICTYFETYTKLLLENTYAGYGNMEIAILHVYLVFGYIISNVM